MNLLALETSADRGSVAVQCGDEIVSIDLEVPREQSARLIPAVDSLLRRVGIGLGALDAIAFGRGPGSFVGVRLAASVTQGLAMASDLGVVAVSSLAALAQQIERRERILHSLVCIDARMGEVYWGEYRVSDGVAADSGREALSRPAEVGLPAGAGWAAAGDGFARFAEPLADHCQRAAIVRAAWVPAAVDLLPTARRALERGEAVAPERLTPTYLREQTAWKRQD